MTHTPAPADAPALRRAMRAARRALPPATRMAGAESVAGRLLALAGPGVAGPVAGYWAMDGEIALHAWQMRLPATQSYCLPVLCDDQLLRFAPWQPGAPLVTNRFGIPEPDVASDALLDARAMSLVVAPLVAFDAQGQRLGMGGGWYDRTFAFRRGASDPPLLVGAAFALQQVDALHAQPWDVPLDAICTDATTLDLRPALPA